MCVPSTPSTAGPLCLKGARLGSARPIFQACSQTSSGGTTLPRTAAIPLAQPSCVLQSLSISLAPIKPAPSGGSRFGSPMVALLAGPGWGKSLTVDESARKTDRVKEVAASIVLPDSTDAFCTHLERTTTTPISFNTTTSESDSDETACFSLVVRVLLSSVCGVS